MDLATASRRLVAVALLLGTTPLLPGALDRSAGAPADEAPTAVQRSVERGSGPAGDLPVVERHVSDDMVVDWTEPPPAGAADWAAGHEEPTGEAAHEHPLEAANAPSAGAPVAPGQGFAVFSGTARWLRTGYSIRLTGTDARVEELRDELVAAASAAQAATGLPVRVASGRGGSEQPSRGEITVVVGNGPCGSNAIGCGGPALTASELVSGRVWIYPPGLAMTSADRMQLAAHELGHALGLQHYDGAWDGVRQAMHPAIQGISSFRSGDLSGLRYMAGALDRPAGAVTGRSYAAGQMRVAGTVASGSKVRVTVGATSRDFAVSGGSFAGAVPAPAGAQQVCATVLDAQPGFRRDLGCGTVTAPGAPLGSFEKANGSFQTIVVSGWAIDPQTADAVQIEVRRGGVLVATGTASAPRPDVGRAQPGYGERHGFRIEVPAVAGSNVLCARVRGVGAGGDRELGCRGVLHAVQPVGAFESAAGGSLGATISGWALDPNTAEAVEVVVSVDGDVPAVPGSFRADDDRPDLTGAFPAHGPAHGFTQDLVLTPGTHEVCLTVRNVGLGQDLRLGCRQVTVTGGGNGLAQVLTAPPGLAIPGGGLEPLLGQVSSTLSGTVRTLLSGGG